MSCICNLIYYSLASAVGLIIRGQLPLMIKIALTFSSNWTWLEFHPFIGPEGHISILCKTKCCWLQFSWPFDATAAVSASLTLCTETLTAQKSPRRVRVANFLLECSQQAFTPTYYADKLRLKMIGKIHTASVTAVLLECLPGFAIATNNPQHWQQQPQNLCVPSRFQLQHFAPCGSFWWHWQFRAH